MSNSLLRKGLPILLMLTASSGTAAAQPAQRLACTIGVDQHYGSGYCDLRPVVNFLAKDRLRIHVGGTAARVVVRLLPEGSSPGGSDIVIREGQIVPPGRVFDVVLTQDYPNTVQVSVHGGSNPWGLYPLGAGNGPATLLSVERLR